MNLFSFALAVCTLCSAVAFIIPHSPLRLPSKLKSTPFLDAEFVSQFDDNKVARLKQELLGLAASTCRGECPTSPEQTEQIVSLVEKLELENKVTGPSTSEGVYGSWDLVYSSTFLFRSSPFFMAARAVCQEGKEAEQFNWFCKQHRKALAFTSIGNVKQIIDKNSMRSEFESKVAVIPGLPVMITGTVVSTAEIVETTDNSWTMYLDKVRIKEGSSNIPLMKDILDNGVALQSRELGSFLESNIDFYSNPKPVFRTYYLDDEVRISRDQDDHVFVYVKSKE